MKKFYGVALIFIALLACVFFPACGNKYKNLKMSFVDADGETLTQINLMIDDDNENALSSMDLSVKFSGIKSKDVGNVSILNPQGNVSIVATNFANGMYNFSISALQAGVGELKVTHLASAKTQTIDLIVDKKSHDLTPTSKKYIYSIPETGTKTVELKSSLVSLYPIDSTDRVYYNFVTDPNISGLTFEREDLTNALNQTNERVIKTLTISSTVADNSEIKIYPITVMDGYPNTSYNTSKPPITIVFKRVLTDQNVVLTSDENHQPYLDANETIHLIAKDSGIAGEEETYEYAYLNAQLKVVNGSLTQSLFDTGFMNFYSYSTSVEAQLSSDKNNIDVNLLQNAIQIYALDYTTNDVTVKIQLLPNNKEYFGEIYPITKTLKVKGELKPNSIEVYMAGELLTVNDPQVSYDLFDYYIVNSNGFISENGFLFNFKPVLEGSFADLKGVQLTLNDETYNALQIYLYNQPLEFVSSGTNNHKSKILTGLELSNIYIKTKSNLSQNETTYSISLETVSVSNLTYLQGINGCQPINVYFKHAQGVDNIVLNAGTIFGGGSGIRPVTENNGANTQVENVYLDVKEGINVLQGQGAYVLYMDGDSSKIEGENGSAVNYANFKVRVENNFGAKHPLMIKQYQSDGDGVGKLQNASTEINYSYSAGTGINNAIILVVYLFDGEDDVQTDVGQYSIVFEHANGYKKTISCLVYRSMTEQDITLSSDINTKGNLAFENSSFKDEGYDADYIVAVGQNLNFKIDNSRLDANLNPRYHFPISLENEIDQIDLYIKKTESLNNVNIIFNKGCFINNQICNIIVQFEVTVDGFTNILTKKIDGDSYSIERTFYAFELIKYSSGAYNNNIVLTDNSGVANNFSIQRYPNGLLGYYFNGESDVGEDLSRVDLKISLNDNNLWNYVLTMPQPRIYGTILDESKVVWNTETANVLIAKQQTDVGLNDPSATLSVQVVGDTVTQTTVVITATITQFKIVIPIKYTIYISIPVISESVEVESGYNINVAEQRPYININEGQEYTISATTSSSVGEVSVKDLHKPDKFEPIVLVVVDNNGNIVDVVEGDKIIIPDASAQHKKLKLYIFALDALKQEVGGAPISNPSNLLMDAYSKAYFELDIIISNGTKANPFLIITAEDFWNLNSNQSLDADDVSYYVLMNNININTQNHLGEQIKNFNGHISTYANENEYVYSLYGISLNNNFKNLFENFTGTIENVNFNVNYNYNLNVDSAQYLGLIDKNNGTLINVTLNVAGQNVFNSNDGYMVNFGCLTGENNGTIKYSSSNVIGVNGTINLSGNALVNFGSLAGVNHGEVIGYSLEDEIDKTLIANLSKYQYKAIANPQVVFTVLLNHGGAFADIEINSLLSNQESAVGGVVGLNQQTETNLKFENGYVAGKISATNSNVGGFVGKNVSTATTIVVRTAGSGYLSSVNANAGEFKFNNLKSAMIINANQNAGGIVGSDEGGHYYNCHYQIFEENSLVGTNNVGGIAGYSKFGVFEFCSVMSYRWIYNELNSTFANENPDIVGESGVGGIVGETISFVEAISSSTYNNLTSILYSSVNAYISAEGELGALFTSNEYSTIVFNAYFVGKLGKENLPQVADNGNLNISNNDTNLIFGNYYYTINESAHAVYFQTIGSETFSLSETSLEHWLQSDSINGGNIFLSLDKVSPLFETSVEFVVEVKEGGWLTDTDNNEIKNLLHLEYYNFLIDKFDANNKQLFSELTEKYNTYSILDLLNISPTEEDPTQTEIRVGVRSLNPDIIRVLGDKLVVLQTGSCKLNFFSAFNNKLNFEIYVEVTTPVGEYSLQESEGAPAIDINSTLKIAKDTSVQLFAKSVGKFEYNEIEYQYSTTTNLYKDVMVECVDGALQGTVADYLTISGQPIVDGKVELTEQALLTIKVLKYLENGKFKITVIPYEIIKFKEGEVEHKIKILKPEISFNVATYQGPTDLYLNYHSSVLCPNNSMSVEALIKTDLPLSEDEAKALIESVQFKKIGETEFTNVDNKEEYYTFLSNSYDPATLTQKVKYKITFKNLLNIQEEQIMRICFSVAGVETPRFVDNVVCPELIDELDVKNYTYEVDDDYGIVYDSNGKPKINENDILRPTGQGLIIVNVTPKNGFYNYLEIKDITGGEEIKFTQLDGVLGNTMPQQDELTTDGLGIKIKKYSYDGFNKSSLYISTQISSSYSNRVHTISVTAFDLEDNPIYTKLISINVKMTPSISIQYRDPNGILYDALEHQTDYLYLAHKLPADLIITPKNADGEVKISCNVTGGTGTVEVVPVLDNLYNIILGNEDSLLGAEVAITANTYATIEGKREYSQDVTIKFKIAEFVVHNASLNNSRVVFADSQKATERILDGTINKPTKLEFLFENSTRTKDISYYNQGNNQNVSFKSTDSQKAEATGALRAIYDILDELNSNTIRYVSLGRISMGEFSAGNVSSSVATLDSNGLTVKDANVKNLAIQVHFFLGLENNVWKVQSYSSNGSVEFKYYYTLNFITSTSFIRPNVIKNEQEFLDMASNAETNYILGNDLVLENYTPIDVNIASFDGNGRKIIIRSFADFDSAEIDVGLFAHIYENMVVMNLVVVYDMYSGREASNPPLGFINSSTKQNSYYNLCTVENVAYNQVRFGGLTPYNQGVITNCQIYGAVAFRASVIEQNVSSASNNQIPFNMAGMVCVNDQTGRISNSDSYLAMAGLVNISGFVYQNSGKIASSSYVADKEFNYNEEISYAQQYQGYSEISINPAGYIFGKNEDVNSPIDTRVTGFANNNSGDISMSYVKISGSNFTAKDWASGFVYTNTGSIYDCFVNQEEFGDVGNEYSGFVQENNGSISTCYTYINNGVWNLDSRNMFAPSNSKNITNSFEIVSVISGYVQSKKIDGVQQIDPKDKSNLAKYIGFAFGNNQSAVWQIAGDIPGLVATDVKVKYSSLQRSTDETYYGLRRVERHLVDGTTNEYEFNIIDDDYGIKTNPYVIYDLNTWNWYFAQATDSNGNLKGSNYYYRIVNDIDFLEIDTTPLTSVEGYTFNGNLQGNNMEMQNVMLYSRETRESIGLFSNVEQPNRISDMDYTIANLKITINSILATKTKAVGALAGLIEAYNIYNVRIDSANNVIVGGNAVGGIAGVIQGNFDVDYISTNVGVNSTVGYSDSLSIYTGNNLSDVYYAGSVFGIAYGGSMSSRRDVNSASYKDIKNVTVSGNIVSIGQIVGSVFGYIGDGVRASNINTTLTNGNIKGLAYSGAMVGENHGIIQNANISVEGEDVRVFSGTNSVYSGFVGLNIDGLILNCSAKLDVEIKDESSTIAGLVGRSVNGYVSNSTYSGKLKGYYTGGVVGSVLSYDVFATTLARPRAIANASYTIDGTSIKPLNNVSVSLDTINYWMQNLSYFYNYYAGAGDLFKSMNRKRVLGFCVATLQSEATNEILLSNYGYNSKEKLLVFNGDYNINKVGMIKNLEVQNGAIYSTPMLNVINDMPINSTYICYIVGAKVSTLDGWNKLAYSDEIVMLTRSEINDLKISKNVEGTSENASFYIYPNATASNEYRIKIVGSKSSSYTISWKFDYLTDILGDGIKVKKGEDEEEIETANNELSVQFTDAIKITFTNGLEDDEEEKIEYTFNII